MTVRKLAGFLAAAAIAAASMWLAFDRNGRLAAGEKESQASSSIAPQTGTDFTTIRVVGFGHVDVEGGTVALTPTVPGRIRVVRVKEGQTVKCGEPILELDPTLAEAQVSEAKAGVKDASYQLREAKRSPKSHESWVRQQEQAIAAAQAKLDAQVREALRAEKLLGTGIPQERVDAAQDLVRELRSNLTAQQLRLDQLQLAKPQEGIRRAEAGLATAKAKLAQAQHRLNEHVLKAPADGLVLRVEVSAGQVLTGDPRQSAVWFCPDSERILRCEIDQQFAGRVSVGMKAQIRDDRDSGPPINGTVSRCADWIAHRRSLLDEPFQQNDVRTLECVIRFDEPQPKLRIGQRLRVVLSSP